MRGIVNILIVILITYTLNAIPVNTSLLSFELIKPWDKVSTDVDSTDEPEVSQVPTVRYSPVTEEELNNPKLITIEFISSMKLTDEQFKSLQSQTTITIFNQIEEKIFSLTDYLVKDSITIVELANGEWAYQASLDFSSDLTGYFMGNYNVSVISNSPELSIEEDLDFLLSYYPTFDYKPAIAEVSKTQVYTQVYYLNESKEFLVPVTKKLQNSSKFIRNTITSLSYEPPNNERIFAQDVLFPKLPRVYLSGGVLSCYLTGSEILKFDSASPSSKLLSEAIVKTLTDIGYVDNLVFYANDRQNGNFINGLPLKTIYNEDYKVYAYVNYYDKNGNGYLVPTEVSNSQETVEDLLNILKTKHKAIGDYGLLTATLPNTVELISQSLEGSTLSLVLSDDFFTAYGDAPSIQEMMMDSLVQTLTSLPSVNDVILTTETHGTGMIGNVPLGTPLKANRFLNPIN